MNRTLIEIHAARVIKELRVLDTGEATRAIAFANTTKGRAEFEEMIESAMPYDQICDQLVWGGGIDAQCVTDEELADELANLTQDEAAELAETIEAERAKAIAELKS